MGGLLRKLVIYICCPLYKMIPIFYKIFYNLANYRLFEETDVIEQLSANLYVLVSVIMLFAFSTTIISAIVNPDLLSDNKKGVAAIFKRSMLGIILMILVPFLFDSAYEVQKSVMDNSLIEKILVGISYENAEENPGGNGGQVIAGTLIASVLYPAGDDITISENVSLDYKEMVQTNIKKIDKIASNINVTISSGGTDEKLKWDFSDENYAFQFNGIIAIIAGGATCYILLLFAMDMAVRLFKLAFLELTAPISIVAYMAAGDNVIKKWAVEVGKTFADVFLRIAAIAFYLFMLNNLPSIMNSFNNEDFSLLLRALIVVGLLIFVKQLPDFIGKVFGINIQSKGGIGGRLGQMAMVGDVAKKGWETVSKGLRNATAIAGAGALGLGLLPITAPTAALGYGLNKATNGGLVRGLRSVGSGFKTAGSVLKGFSSGNPINAIPNAVKGYKDSDIVKQKQKLSGIKKNEALLSSVGLDEIGSLKTDTIDGANAAVAELKKKISASNISENAKKILNQKLDAERVNSIMQKLKTSNDDIKDLLSTAASNAKTQVAQEKIENLKQSFMTGNESLESLTTKLNNMVKDGTLSEGSAKEIVSKINKIDSISQSKEFEEVLNKDNNLIEVVKDANGEIVSRTIKTIEIARQAGKTEDKAKVVKEKYDATLEGVSDKEKQEIERLASVGESVNSEYARKNSGKRGDEYSYKVDATSQPSQNQSTTSSSSQAQNMTDEEIMELMSETQAEINEERLNNAWRNQTTDETYRRGSYEPENNSNNNSSSDDGYDDIYQQYYDDANNDNNE